MGEAQARVLVVDDERFFREAIRDALAAAGHACVAVESGHEALERAHEPRLGVVILDIQMPGMNGLEVLRRLRESHPLLRVIILSTHTEQEVVLDALRLGATDYLAKPLHEEELVLAVERALEGHEITSRWEQLRARVQALPAKLAELREVASGATGEERSSRLRNRAAAAAAELLDAARTSVMLLDKGENVLRVQAAVGASVPPAEMDPVPVGQGASGIAFERGEQVLVRDAGGAGYSSPSYALTPIGEGEDRLGVLCATEPAAGSFEEEDLALLRLLAQEVSALLAAPASLPVSPALELEDDELLAQSAGETVAEALRSEHDVELARAVCAATTSEVAPERILGAALAAASAALGGAPVSLHLLDPASGELLIEAERDAAARPDRDRLPRARGLTGTVLETRCPVSSAEPESDPRFDPEVDTPEDGKPGPFLCVPVCFRGRSLGVFRAFPACADRVSARTAEILASSLSAAVRNVLLYRSLLESIEEVARVRRDARARTG
jgi:DNA-binding response OmpR family regulator